MEKHSGKQAEIIVVFDLTSVKHLIAVSEVKICNPCTK